jgi:flagellar motor switch protein FliN
MSDADITFDDGFGTIEPGIEVTDAELEAADAVLAAPEGAVATMQEAAGVLDAPEDALAEVALEQLTADEGRMPIGDLAPVLDVPVELSVEIGRTTMTIGETLAIGPGTIVSLNRMIGEPVDLLVNGKYIARGEVVAVDEEFGLRVTEVLSTDARLDAL